MIEFAAIKFHDDLMSLEGEINFHLVASGEALVFTETQKERMATRFYVPVRRLAHDVD